MARLTAASAEKQHLLAEVLRARGSARLGVSGSSMLPTIWPGDVAVLERMATADLQTGDVILFRQDSRLFLHRIVCAENAQFITRGDSMPQADPVVRQEQILAKASALERDGDLICSLDLSFWRGVLGRLIAHSGLATRAALRLHQIRRGRNRGAESSPDGVCEA